MQQVSHSQWEKERAQDRKIVDLVCGCNGFHDSLRGHHDATGFGSQAASEELLHQTGSADHSIDRGGFVAEDSCSDDMAVSKQADLGIAEADHANLLGLGCRARPSEVSRGEMRSASIVGFHYMTVVYQHLADGPASGLAHEHQLLSCRVEGKLHLSSLQDFELMD